MEGCTFHLWGQNHPLRSCKPQEMGMWHILFLRSVAMPLGNCGEHWACWLELCDGCSSEICTGLSALLWQAEILILGFSSFWVLSSSWLRGKKPKQATIKERMCNSNNMYISSLTCVLTHMLLPSFPPWTMLNRWQCLCDFWMKHLFLTYWYWQF